MIDKLLNLLCKTYGTREIGRRLSDPRHKLEPGKAYLFYYRDIYFFSANPYSIALPCVFAGLSPTESMDYCFRGANGSLWSRSQLVSAVKNVYELEYPVHIMDVITDIKDHFNLRESVSWVHQELYLVFYAPINYIYIAYLPYSEYTQYKKDHFAIYSIHSLVDLAGWENVRAEEDKILKEINTEKEIVMQVD